MKELFSLIIIVITMSSSCPGEPKNEHSTALKKIRAQRLANLKSMVTLIEGRVAGGMSGADELIEAKLDLLKFEREEQRSAQEKIFPQEKIVSLEETRHSQVAVDFKSGLGSNLKLLKSRDRVLAAKQRLLELRTQATPSQNEGKE